jgi:hypothetical protein
MLISDGLLSLTLSSSFYCIFHCITELRSTRVSNLLITNTPGGAVVPF